MTNSRKDEHVQLAEDLYSARHPAGFKDVKFIHNSLPGINVREVDTRTTVAGQHWSFPCYINAMTGGSEKTGRINAELAQAAAETGLAIASGSLSQVFKDPSSAGTFSVIRKNAPQAFVFANVNATATVSQAQQAVDILEANALQIHINVAQELVMPEGDRDFRDWLDQIATIVSKVPVPVVVKEVGFGLGRDAIMQLVDCGVKTVDVSGRGGTNFVSIENQRRSTPDYSYLTDWGHTAVECLLDVLHKQPNVEVDVLASGGVSTPLDALKLLSLGAKAVGVSGHFLHILMSEGLEGLVAEIRSWQEQLRSLMTLTGAKNVPDLTRKDVLITGETAEFARLRSIDVVALAQRSKTA